MGNILAKVPPRIEDLTGQRFNKLVALNYVEKYSWECLCDCGKIIITRSKTLKSGNTKSCGCIQIRDIKGDMFGYLEAINMIDIVPTIGARWRCKCTCGKYLIVQLSNITSGNTKSCGCMTKEIIKNTCIEKYGKEHHSQHHSVKNKKIKTNIKRYGVKYPSQNEKIRKKQKATLMRNYGVENPSQSPEIALRAAKSQNNSFVLRHWKTNEEIVCVASYEKKTVEYFNKNNINFKWQHKTFAMPDGRTFRPDCYLIGKRKPWVEIKGYFRGDAQEKWEWFHKEHPNSEIWNKEKLLEMGIL